MCFASIFKQYEWITRMEANEKKISDKRNQDTHHKNHFTF